MKREILKSVLPFVKEYAAGRHQRGDQGLPQFMSGNAVWGIVNDKVIHRGNFNVSFCYDSLNKSTLDAQAILLQIQPCPEDLDQEAYRHYIQWVLNYSPWRHIFVSKSINKVMKDGVVVVDPDSQKNTMIGGCIALRQAWCNYNNNPRYRQINLWWELIQKVDPLYAAAISYNILCYDNGGKIQEGIIFGGHSPIGQGSHYSSSLDNFVRGDMKDDSNPWIKSRVGEAWNLWEHGGKVSKLPKLVHTAITGIGKAKSKVNVFKNEDSSELYDPKDIIDCLINEIPNMEKEIAL